MRCDDPSKHALFQRGGHTRASPDLCTGRGGGGGGGRLHLLCTCTLQLHHLYEL